MNYSVNQLHIFLKVVETKSITKAADELYMTQPAVSIQLKNFQEQFKFPLTEIIGRKLYVTDFGYEIAALVGQIMEGMNTLKFKTKAYDGLLAGRLKISSVSTGKYIIPYFLTDFLSENQGVDLLLDVTNKAKVVESLKNNEIDFALVSKLPVDVEVEEEILVENKLYFVGGQHLSTSQNETLIYRELGSATRIEMEKYFLDERGVERKKMELTSNEAVKQAVIAGLGCSILPLIGIKNELQNKSLIIVPRPGLPIITQWRLIWLKNKKMTPVTSAFLSFIRDNKSHILAKNFNWHHDF